MNHGAKGGVIILVLRLPNRNVFSYNLVMRLHSL